MLYNQFLSAQTNIVIDRKQIVGTSKFQWGQTIVDGSLREWNPVSSVSNAIILLKSSPRFVNTHIMGWGQGDPWIDPNKTEPTDFAALDKTVNLILSANCTPVLTLCEAPWWMKGRLNTDGSTTLLTEVDEWANIAYKSRIIDNKMDKWLLLVRRVAERYMVVPYNVRYFQVWNELKGYYNPSTNNSDFTTSAGDPTGANAKHGYTFMYNKVYDLLKLVATEKGINPSTINVGGPYPVMMSENSTTMSDPSSLSGAWGVMDQRSLNALSYWLNNKNGGEFICFDGGNVHKTNPNLVNSFEMCEKFKAANNWVRQQTNGKTIPIWWSENYMHLNELPNTEEANNALGAYTSIKMITSDASVALLWGNDTINHCMPPLWSNTTLIGGGLPFLWFNSTKTINFDFGSGKTICKSTSSSPDVAVLATDNKAMLINKTNQNQAITLNGEIINSLYPYEVRFIDFNSLTAINEDNFKKDITIVYPSRGNKIIQISSLFNMGSIYITSVTGNHLYEDNSVRTYATINISMFLSGLYILKINGEKTLKFIL